MNQGLSISKLSMAGIAVAMLVGCGGGGGGGSSVSHPSTLTTAHVGDLFNAYRLSVVCDRVAGYGKKPVSVPTYDAYLDLYGTVRIAPSALAMAFFTDAAKTTLAGSCTYNINDAAQTQNGSLSIDLGRYAGLSGFYNASLQGTGINGNVNYSLPNVGTFTSQFALQSDDVTGALFGTATNAIALEDGYNQTEKVTTAADGTRASSTTDGHNLVSNFNFALDGSGKGTITGVDPGLPASFSWDDSGTGKVVYADGSSAVVSHWQFSG